MKKIGVVEGYYGKSSNFDDRKKIIEEININNINPVQALVKLNEIIDLLKSSKK